MGKGSIGIKLADSKFFPILEEGSAASKVLDLTTVRDDQTSVQINLFKSETNSIDDSEYVGTLIIEDIAEKPAGEPTIELKLSLDSFDELSAEAVDLDSGSRQVLTVSLATIDKESLYNLPDFDLTPVNTDLSLGDDPYHENVVASGTVPGNAPEGLYEMNQEEEKKGGIFLPAWLCALILILGVAALVLALLVLSRVMIIDRSIKEAAANTPPVVETVVPVEAPPPAAEEKPAEVTPPPTVEEPVAVVVEEPVVPVQPEPAPEAKAIRYKIRWGDTLWDLSETYYKTPWLYPVIAKHNKIRNPNLIISGTWIEIPPQ